MFIEIILFIFIGLAIRFILSIFGLLPEKIDSIRDRINYFVFYYIIPILCFKTTYTMPFSLNHLKVSLVANLTILSCVAVSWFIYKKISRLKPYIKPEVIGSLIICSSFGNVLYIGLPVITKLYGDKGISYAFTYDFLASTPLVWTVAVAVCMRYGIVKSFTLKNSILTIIKIPPIWGLVFGLIIREINYPLLNALLNLLKDLPAFVTYLMLIIVGISLKLVSPEKFILSIPAISVKLFISPLFALIFGTMTGLSGIPLNICIIDAAMPSMLLSMIFATAFGVDLRTTIEMIFFTTMIFLICFSILSGIF